MAILVSLLLALSLFERCPVLIASNLLETSYTELLNEVLEKGKILKLNCPFTEEDEVVGWENYSNLPSFAFVEVDENSKNKFNLALYVSKEVSGYFMCNQVHWYVEQGKATTVKSKHEQIIEDPASNTPTSNVTIEELKQRQASKSRPYLLAGFWEILKKKLFTVPVITAVVIYALCLVQIVQISSNVKSSSLTYAKIAFILKYGELK